MDIQEKFKLYLELNKEIVEFRKKQREQKKVLDQLEKEIHEYMSDNNMDNISLKDGEIVLYDRKVSQSFKRPAIVEKLTEKLRCDEKKAEDIAESILTNKVFTVEKKIKVNIKKQK
jgi:malonyl CoA-acyl carrier protein transacylase